MWRKGSNSFEPSIFLKFFSFLTIPHDIWQLSSLTRDGTCTPYIARQHLNYWTTRKDPEPPTMKVSPMPLFGWIWVIPKGTEASGFFKVENLLCFGSSQFFCCVGPESIFILGAYLLSFWKWPFSVMQMSDKYPDSFFRRVLYVARLVCGLKY